MLKILVKVLLRFLVNNFIGESSSNFLTFLGDRIFVTTMEIWHTLIDQVLNTADNVGVTTTKPPRLKFIFADSTRLEHSM